MGRRAWVILSRYTPTFTPLSMICQSRPDTEVAGRSAWVTIWLRTENGIKPTPSTYPRLFQGLTFVSAVSVVSHRAGRSSWVIGHLVRLQNTRRIVIRFEGCNAHPARVGWAITHRIPCPLCFFCASCRKRET